MALSQVGLERLNTATTKKIGTAKNLITNGACLISQRGTSSALSGYHTVDRFKAQHSGTDEAPTQSQADVASGTTPYSLGFRKCLKILNGNQTSVSTSDYMWIQYFLEAQDIANSGWNYTSSSSYITLSFWVKSSVAQDFKGYLKTVDGTTQRYAFATGSLSADTWTKITKTIPGNSNLQFDNNNDKGFEINILPYLTTDYTDASVTENAWGAFSSGARAKVTPTDWWTTDNATFEMTGLQLEVGSVATDFEFVSHVDEMRRCERYFEICATGEVFKIESTGGYVEIPMIFRTEKRSTPTMTLISSDENFVSSVTVVGGNSTEKIYQAGLRGNTVVTTGNKYLYGKASAAAEL